MTTVEEAQAHLAAARDNLFPQGQWEDIHNALHEAYAARVLTDQEQGEMAFYLGEACLNTNRYEAETYLQDAYHLASTDFSAWAEDELHKLHPQAATDDYVADGQPAETQTADVVPAEEHQPAVDVSSHPDLQLDSTYADWVAHAQAKLAHLQYYNGRIDGYFGPITDAAVRHLQDAYGMAADGVIGQTLWLALETHAPGVTGHPDGSAGHAQAAHVAAAQAAPQDSAVTMPDDTIQGTPEHPDYWNPQTPDVTAPDQALEKSAISEAGEVEISFPIPIEKSFGPVTVKEIPIKITGQLSSEKGQYVAVTNTVGTKQALKIETGSWELLKSSAWEIGLKGSAEIGASGGIAGVLEIKHGHVAGEVEFALVKLAKGEYHFAEVTPSIGGELADYPVHLDDNRLVYFTGKAQAGVALTPNLAWFAQRGLEATAETAGTSGATAAAGGAEAAGGVEAAEGGAAAVGAGELIIATGFVAAAVAVLYVGYANMRDLDKLQQLRTDSDKAVEDFSRGFVAAWTKGTTPGGYWGGAGTAAGQKQFDADVHGFEELMRKRHPGQTLDAETLEAVKESWHQSAAEKQSAFEAVASAMFGKMVRTAIYQSWLKANSDSSLPGDITETAKHYSGISGGGSTQPDVMAGQAAAKNANIQLDVDRWQHALDE